MENLYFVDLKTKIVTKLDYKEVKKIYYDNEDLYVIDKHNNLYKNGNLFSILIKNIKRTCVGIYLDDDSKQNMEPMLKHLGLESPDGPMHFINNLYELYYLNSKNGQIEKIADNVKYTIYLYKNNFYVDTNNYLHVTGYFLNDDYNTNKNTNIKVKYITGKDTLFCYIDYNDEIFYFVNKYNEDYHNNYNDIAPFSNGEIRKLLDGKYKSIYIFDNYIAVISLQDDVYVIANDYSNKFGFIDSYNKPQLIPNIKCSKINIYIDEISNDNDKIVLLDLDNNLWILNYQNDFNSDTQLSCVSSSK